MIGTTPVSVARQNLVAGKVAAVGQGGYLLTARGLLRLQRHRCKLMAIIPLIGHLVGYDQMMLGVDGNLDIVADGGGTFAAGRHRPGVGIGQRDLLVGRVLDRLLHYLQGLHLLAQAGNLLLQPDRLRLGDIALFAVGPVQCPQVTRDAGLDLFHPSGDLGHRIVLVTIVHRFELAAVDGNHSSGEQAQLAAQHHKLGTHHPDRRAIVLAEVGNRLEVGSEPPDQPHQLDIALRFPFQPPARLQAVEVAIEVDLQQRRGMICRPACRRRCHPRKPQGSKVQFVDEDLDHPNRVLLADVILQAVRQQRRLPPVFAIDEPMHRHIPEAPSFRILKRIPSGRNPTALKYQAVFTRAGAFAVIPIMPPMGINRPNDNKLLKQPPRVGRSTERGRRGRKTQAALPM